jgi:hypothetical protein
MQGSKLLYPMIVPGTLSANVVTRFTAPIDMTLEMVSASASNDSDATLMVGNASDDDAYLEAATIGDSGVPVEKTKANFVGSQPVHITDGTTIVVTVDFDGSSGTAAQNLQVLLVFSEG